MYFPLRKHLLRKVSYFAIAYVAGSLSLTGLPNYAVAQAPSPSPSPSPSQRQQEEALLSADSLNYEEETGIVRAKGNVEIVFGDRILQADEIIYDSRKDMVMASGNVALLLPSGEVLFADYIELTDDLREGFIKQASALLYDDTTRIAAASGTRSQGRYTTFNKAVFSPCELCKEDPTRPPVWQIKANKVIHDQEDHTITYRDATMEFLGVPIAYTPYFSHADPSVERKTGFLFPSFIISDATGFGASMPYYVVIDRNEDFTFAPIFTTEQGAILTGEYRKLFYNGEFEVDGSATIDDFEGKNGDNRNNRFRGHIDGAGKWDIDENWRAGFDVLRSTDDTYLREFDFSNDALLTSQVYGEGFFNRSYVEGRAMAFQAVRQNQDTDEQPIVAPLLSYNYVSEPEDSGLYFTADSSLLSIARIDGYDTQRVSAIAGAHLPLTGHFGELYRLSASVEGDGYWTHGFEKGSPRFAPVRPGGEDFAGRIFPRISLFWEWPWVSTQEGFQQVVTPIAQAVVAPEGINSKEIPNEDSRDLEFDDTNLFSLNRFPGIDRVDSGQRLDYGLKYQFTMDSGLYSEVFAGQSYAINHDGDYVDGSGLEGNFSDFVGRVVLRPIKEIDLTYRFRLDKRTLDPKRNQINLRAGIPELTVSANYNLFEESSTPVTVLGKREEIQLGVSTQINDYWRVGLSALRDLERKRTLSTRLSLLYEDDCFLIETDGQRRKFRDRSIDPEYVIQFRIGFKLLGEISAGS